MGALVRGCTRDREEGMGVVILERVRGRAVRGRRPELYLLVEHLDQLDDSRVRTQPTKGLNLPQIVHLLLALERALHAFDGCHLAVLHTLGLEHLRESPLPFLCDQSIFFM